MEKLNRQVRKAQRWLGLQRFFAALGWCWCVALLIALAVVVLDKYHPLGVDALVWVLGALGLGVVAAAFWAVMRGRGRVDAAIEIDLRFGLKERVSSALAMSDEERGSSLGQALVDDAVRRVRRIDVSEHFKLSARQLFLPLTPAVLPLVIVVLVVWLFNPLGGKQAEATTDPLVKKQIERSSDSLRQKLLEQRKKAQEQGLKDAHELLKRLEEEAEDMASRSQGDRKDAMVKLNDLAREVENRRREFGGAERMREQLGQLKQVEQGPADKLLKALKQGDFNKAIQELNDLKSKIAEAELSKEEREKLAEQLDKMREKLEKMAAAQRDAEKDLEKRIQQARQAGRKEEAERLQEQLNQLQQQRQQMNQLQDMANKMGQCAQCLRDGQLKDAGDMLQSLQGDVASLREQLQEMQMLNEALNQLSQCRNQMNCQKCGGAGCQACQGPPGIGLGRGQGIGPRPEAEDDVDFIDARPPMKVGKGSATIGGEVEGPNLKGNVQQEIRAQIQAAREKEADTVTIQHLPKGYQQHALEYHRRMREGD